MSHIMPVYAPAPVTPVRGDGPWLYEADGTAWLDCIGGVATNALGHCHPDLIDALTAQAHKLWHVSNALHIEGQELLAEKLTSACSADLAFFCNTGTEAVECAIKVARKFHAHHGAQERVDIIGFGGSFHGRTLAALNASGNAAYLDGFGPRMPGFVQVSLDDTAAIETAIASPTTAAVIVEPVQGEGGARVVPNETLQLLRRLCTQHGVLLILDEVQSGMGRTGRMFAHQWVDGAEPDVMAVAKALGAGFPVAACLATRQAAIGMTGATHGSTFGGNPLAMSVGNRAFDIINGPGFLEHTKKVSHQLREELAVLAHQYSGIIAEIRGAGLLVGLKLAINNRTFIATARECGLLLAGGGDNIVRLLPPLNITAEHIGEIMQRLRLACDKALQEAS